MPTDNLLPDKVSNRLSSNNTKWSSFRPSRKFVSAYDKSSISFSIRRVHNVNNKVGEQLTSSGREKSFFQTGLGLELTLFAAGHVLPHIKIHPVPEISS